jgi:hypothetical protein
MQRPRLGQAVYEYDSINTWVLETIVEQITHKPVAECFGGRVWRRVGA